MEACSYVAQTGLMHGILSGLTVPFSILRRLIWTREMCEDSALFDIGVFIGLIIFLFAIKQFIYPALSLLCVRLIYKKSTVSDIITARTLERGTETGWSGARNKIDWVRRGWVVRCFGPSKGRNSLPMY